MSHHCPWFSSINMYFHVGCGHWRSSRQRRTVHLRWSPVGHLYRSSLVYVACTNPWRHAMCPLHSWHARQNIDSTGHFAAKGIQPFLLRACIQGFICVVAKTTLLVDAAYLSSCRSIEAMLSSTLDVPLFSWMLFVVEISKNCVMRPKIDCTNRNEARQRLTRICFRSSRVH